MEGVAYAPHSPTKVPIGIDHLGRFVDDRTAKGKFDPRSTEPSSVLKVLVGFGFCAEL